MDSAVELTGDPYFGLYAADFLHVANLHALGYAMTASGTLRELSNRVTRYFRLLSGSSRPRLNVHSGEARLEIPIVAEPPPLTDDIFGLFLVRLFSELSDGKVRPIRIEQHRASPPDGGARSSRSNHLEPRSSPLCAGGLPVTVLTGLNTLLMFASAAPTPDIVALAATPTGDGIVNVPGNTGANAFAIATVNVGVSGNITATRTRAPRLCR